MIGINIPNPGSDEAIKAGCTCPAMDNGHGNGCGKTVGGTPMFWLTEGCPLHGKIAEVPE